MASDNESDNAVEINEEDQAIIDELIEDDLEDMEDAEKVVEASEVTTEKATAATKVDTDVAEVKEKVKEEETEPPPEVTVADSDKSSCTLFVSNLPNTANSKDLEKVFSDIGPIKRCFVVASSDKNKKGFGYVTFAVREDAEKAIDSVKNIGSSKVFAKFAKKRGASDEDGAESPAKKARSSNKSARIIIRNVKFEAKEDEIRKAFTTFGDIQEISYPKRKGGRSKGFCFVQYQKIIDAKNAIEQMNGRDFLGRPLIVDWSVPKDKFDDTEKKESKDEKDKEAVDNKAKKKKDDKATNDKATNDKAANDKAANDKQDDDEEESARTSDVEEGKTVFLRNVPFDATEQDLYEAFCPYGQIKYAVICIDTFTEHPKGTAFVQFIEKEDADSCLKKANDESEGGITVNDRKVDVTIAVSREELQRKKEEIEDKKKEKKDSRNLYLAREGQIRPGTDAAEGVSSSDMGKRLELEAWKSKMLKNTNMFISDKRLCVRNIPPKMKNKRLRDIFEAAAGAGAEITELTIMRDLNKGGKEDPPTKGFGFVAFSKHENALAALRDVNNNPKYFSKDQRPIVEFSLESRAALKAKEDRLQKSKDNLNKTDGNRKRKGNAAGSESDAKRSRNQQGQQQGQQQRNRSQGRPGQQQRNQSQGRPGQQQRNQSQGRQGQQQRNLSQGNQSQGRQGQQQRNLSQGRQGQQQRNQSQGRQGQMQRNQSQGRQGQQQRNQSQGRLINRDDWEDRRNSEVDTYRVLDQIRSYMGSAGMMGSRPFPSHSGPKVRHSDRNQRFNIWQ